jgi:cysteinyl-tRNA synthetase
LSHHYREKWEFNFSQLAKSQKLNALFQKAWQIESTQGNDLDFSKEKINFFEALNDDLNTPLALNILKELSEKILKSNPNNPQKAKEFLNTGLKILGLSVEDVN